MTRDEKINAVLRIAQANRLSHGGGNLRIWAGEIVDLLSAPASLPREREPHADDVCANCGEHRCDHDIDDRCAADETKTFALSPRERETAPEAWGVYRPSGDLLATVYNDEQREGMIAHWKNSCPGEELSFVPLYRHPRAGTVERLNAMAGEIAAQNQKWWLGPDGSKLTRNAGELLMLVVSEVVEAFEGERKNLMDDKLPHRRMAEVEIADAIVLLLDYSAARGYDLDGAMREKLEYNASRADHKKESAQIAVKNPLNFESVYSAPTPPEGGTR